MPDARVVVGGTPAALVTADALGAAGVPVRLLLPARGVGRGFAALPHDGRMLQLGVRLLELSYEDDAVPPPLSAYRPGIDGHRPFARRIRGWVQELVGDRLTPIAPPRVVVDRTSHEDYLFTVDLAGAAYAVSPHERRQIGEEAAAAARRLGDAGLLAGELGALSLADASVANHGKTFHERLIEPLAQKFLRGGSSAILATWRRKAWLPLFWPRTVREVFRGEEPTFRPSRTFDEVAPGGVGGLFDALTARLSARPTVELVPVSPLASVEAHGDRLRLTFSDGRREEAARPALGVPTSELYAALGIQLETERMRTVTAWIEADRQAFAEGLDLVHVVDADNPIVRVSGGSTTLAPNRRVVCVELRHDLPIDSAAAAAIAGLQGAGLLEGGAPASIHEAAMAALPVPSGATHARLTTAHDELADRALGAHLLGGALAPGADSLNEQILQGLRTAEAMG